MSQQTSTIPGVNEGQGTLVSSMAHVPELVQTKHVRAGVQGGGAIGRFNAAVSGPDHQDRRDHVLRLRLHPARVGCAAVGDWDGHVTVLVNWISSNFLQLVLLPIIIVGQNVISRPRTSAPRPTTRPSPLCTG